MLIYDIAIYDVNSFVPQFDTDTLVPPKHGVMTPFAKFAWAFIIVFVMLLVWMGFDIFKYQRFRNSNNLVHDARDAIQASDWERAARNLAQARKLAPGNREVTKVIIELLKVTGADPEGLLQMIRDLNQHEAPTAELTLLMARTLFRLGRLAEAREWFAGLPKLVQEQSEALDLMAGILDAEGKTREAAEFAHRSILAMPQGPAKDFRAAAENVRHPFASTRQRGRQTLWSIARSQGEFAMPAISQLASLSDLTADEGESLLKLVEEHAGKEMLPVRLTVVSAMVRVQPEKRSELCAGEVKHFQQRHGADLIPTPAEKRAPLALQNLITGSTPSEPPVYSDAPAGAPEPVLGDDVRIFCRWLAQEKQPELLQKLLPQQTIQTSTELFTCLAWALSEDQQWGKLEDLLAGPKPALNPTLISIWSSVVDAHLHPEKKERSKLLMGAIDGATKNRDSQTLLAAALAAEQLNEQAIALSACQAIASFDKKRAVATLEQAYGRAEGLKDTTAMLNAAFKLHALRPDNRGYALRLAYLQLICGRDFEIAIIEAGGGEEDPGGRSLHELLQALAAYRLADPEGVKRHLQGISRSDEFTVGQRAAFAGLLSKTGEVARAFQVAEKIPQNLLLPEEAALLHVAL